MTDKGQFEQGFEIPVQHQDVPGLDSKLSPTPLWDQIPTEDGGAQPYKAAGKLTGKRALITGGDSGIGRSIAVLFAMEGADSFIVYLPQEQSDAEDTKKMVESRGRKCYLFPTDVTSQENCKKVVDEAVKAMGGIDILINNAAYQMMKMTMEELSEDQWIHTFNTNIHPYFYISKYALPHMKKGSAIINTASVNAYIGRPDLLDYTSTKGAIVSFTRGLANMYADKGIRVNAVAPGPVWTPLITATMNDDAQKQFTAPIGRPLQPSEIATNYVFLASMDSSALTGQTLHPNGGMFVTS